MIDPRLKLELTLNPGTIFVGNGGVEKWVSTDGVLQAIQNTTSAKPRLDFDGATFDGGDALDMPMSNTLNWGSGNFTARLWVKASNLLGVPLIIGVNAGTSVAALMIFNYTLYMASNSSSWSIVGLSIGGATTGAWIHYAIVGDNGTIRTYKNGVQQATGTQPTMYFSLSDKLSIGARTGAEYFTGKINDISLMIGTCLYPGGTSFNPPPRSQLALPTTPMPPLAAISAAALNNSFQMRGNNL